MKKFFLLSSIIILIFASCKQKKNKVFYEYNFIPVDSFSLPLKDSVHNLAYDLQLIKTDTANYLFVYFHNDFITIYNLDKKEIIKEIPLKKGVPIFSFNAISYDSIYVFYNSSYLDFYHDSLFQLIDSNGKVLKSYNITYKNYFKTHEIDTNNFEFQYSINALFYKFPYLDGKLLFTVYKLNEEYIGDSAGKSRVLPPVGFIDTKTNKISFIDFPLYYPPEGYYYSKNIYYKTIFKSADDNILFVQGITPDIWEYNFSTQKKKKYRLASILLDSIAPVNINDTTVSFLYFHQYKGVFGDIIFDKYRQLYYRLCYLPSKIYKKNKTFIVTDKNFNKLGEGIMPDDYFHKMFFDEDYIYMINRKKTFKNEGKIFFTKFKIKKTKTTKNDFLKNFTKNEIDTSTCNISFDSTNGKNVSIFLDNYIHKNNYKVLIVPFLKSCPSCRDYAVWFYSLNKIYFSKNNVFLLMDYGNIAAIKSYLANYNLRLTDKNVILDTLNIYDEYVSTSFYNPRVVVICNNKVKFDKTYYPNELENIGNVLLDDSFCDK